MIADAGIQHNAGGRQQQEEDAALHGTRLGRTLKISPEQEQQHQRDRVKDRDAEEQQAHRRHQVTDEASENHHQRNRPGHALPFVQIPRRDQQHQGKCTCGHALHLQCMQKKAGPPGGRKETDNQRDQRNHRQQNN